jgi:UDP-glucose 4-epimerase
MKGPTRDTLPEFRRALVTGGGGFIGSHLVDALLDGGLEVASVDDYSSGHRANLTHRAGEPRLRVVECDVADAAALAPHFRGVDVVFHNAACKKTLSLLDPRKDVDTNVKGTLNVMLAAREHGARKVVVASTGSVYGEAVELPQTESHPLRPVSLYGIDKLAGESIALLLGRELGVDVTVLRYFHVYGPRQESGRYGGVIAIFCEQLLRGEPATIYGDGSQQRSFTYVADVVRANLLVARDPRSRGEAYNCASGLKITVAAMYAELQALAGRSDLPPRFGPWAPGDIKLFDVSSAKLQALGMGSYTPFPEGLKRTFDWFRERQVAAPAAAPGARA